MGQFEQLAVGSSAARIYLPDGGDGPGVVVLHPWWGLNADVVAYADRLADAGFRVIAPDLFAGDVAETIDGAERLSSAAEANAEGLLEIVLAATDDLAARLGNGAGIATLGFSFGAGYALWSASRRPSIAANVLYYGTMTGPSLAKSTATVLGHFAEDDPYENDESIGALEEGLSDAGRELTVHRYPGTGHWFAEPSRDAYVREAADLAFERTVEFLNDRLGGYSG